MGSTSQDNTKAITKLAWLKKFQEIIFGCFIVAVWTLIRLFNHAPNFDQLGQQVLAHQWLHGLHSGSVIGPTNYVLKMVFLYMPMDILPLPAQLKLVFVTLVVNILTFVLIVYALKKIWLEFYPSIKKSFYWPVIYLALISGSVYWISFSNSRNLEVAGGLLLIWLYIRALRKPSAKSLWPLIALGALLFFADPLQIYMTLLPVLVFIGSQWFFERDRKKLIVILKVFGCALLSILFARVIVKIVESVWRVSFIEAPHQLGFSSSSMKSALEQIAKLYAGGYEGGHLRQAVNIMVLAAGMLGVAFVAWKKPKSRQLVGLIGVVWIIDLAVYILSGQAQQLDTNRYLIMTVPMFILALILVLYYLPASRLRNHVITFVLLYNVLTLGVAFAQAWNPGFSNNNHARAAISYMEENKLSYGYASIGTAISSDYLSNGRLNFLTLGCEPDFTLKRTNLFFDKGAFETGYEDETFLPIILDGDSIKINQAACRPEQIQKQLGQWQKTDKLSDGSTVLLYSNSKFKHLR